MPDAELSMLLVSGAFFGIGFAGFGRGKDNSISLTNVQLILWSGSIIGSYVATAALNEAFLGNLPNNLLALMGISAGSYVTAASTRSLQSRNKRPYHGGHTAWGMLSSESNPQQLSLPKLQVFFWTVIAILIYWVIVWNGFSTAATSLPDPGSGLVALMGISHGAYLGNKFSDTPKEGGEDVEQFPVSPSSALVDKKTKVKALQGSDYPTILGLVRNGKLTGQGDPNFPELEIQANDIILAFGDDAQLARLGSDAGST